jgi:hypothetical protein
MSPRRRALIAAIEAGMTLKVRKAFGAIKRSMTTQQLSALKSFRAQRGKPEAKPGKRTWFGTDVDDRPHVQALLRAIRAALPRLLKLHNVYNSHWDYEDRIYRFYYGSFKVYRLQAETKKIVRALRRLLPKRKLTASFEAIVKRGTGKTWTLDHNSRWDEETAPIVEAFFHARYFLDMAVRYGQELKFAPSLMPSGWAALLCLYELR